MRNIMFLSIVSESSLWASAAISMATNLRLASPFGQVPLDGPDFTLRFYHFMPDEISPVKPETQCSDVSFAASKQAGRLQAADRLQIQSAQENPDLQKGTTAVTMSQNDPD